MSSSLFSPINLRQVTLGNRVVIAPMCQYSATDGCAGDWHLMHYGQLCMSGTGLLIMEAAGVEPQGRLTPRGIGIYSDETEEALGRVVKFCKDYGNVTVGLQLCHGGRKSSVKVPWQDRKLVPPEAGGWRMCAASPIPGEEGWPDPEELDEAGLARIKAAFVDATERSARIGIDLLEIHGAHGYLLHLFLSPLTNKRQDRYGGSRENRMRYPLEVFEAMRAVWPADKPLGVRVSAIDWVAGGLELEDTIAFAKALEARDCDFIHVSSGGLVPAEFPIGPGYQVDLAAAVKKETTMPVMAVGMIDNARQADTIVRSDQADMVALGRSMLFNPHWTWQAALELGEQAPYPPQYARAHPSFTAPPVPANPPAAEE
jgi:2,4-dienoyl-CoA reductase-like NADH-dependent reductase (Old Yellow Enzyme family)